MLVLGAIVAAALQTTGGLAPRTTTLQRPATTTGATSPQPSGSGWTQPKLTGPDVAIGQIRLVGLGGEGMTFPTAKPGITLTPPRLPVGIPAPKGCRYEVSVDVRNVGEISAQPFAATFTSSIAVAGAMLKQVAWLSWAPLLPGESSIAKDTLALNAGGETVKIDLKSSPTDPNPADNKRSLSVMVPPCTSGTSSGPRTAAPAPTWTQPKGTPDLVISGLEIMGHSTGLVTIAATEPGGPPGKCSFPVRFLLSNVGAAGVPTVAVDFLMGGGHHEVQQFANLMAGEIREIHTTGWMLPGENATFDVTADPNGTLPEIREDNNQDWMSVWAYHSCAS